jgi:PAN domain
MQAAIFRLAGLTIAICSVPVSGMTQTFSPTFEQSIVRPGSDYRTFDSGPEAKSCQNSCMADPQCRAWSYEKPTCWLKNRVPLPAISPHMVSGVVRR